MKLIYTIFLFFASITVNGQRIEEDKIDEFTKNAIKRTSWETLTNPSFSGNFASYVRISMIDSVYYLNFKMWMDYVFSISQNSELMLKLENNTIITLYTLESMISCRGCGAKGIVGSDSYGVKLDFLLHEEDIKSLKKYKISKLRVYTTDGYLEKDIKKKFSETLINELDLFN